MATIYKKELKVRAEHVDYKENMTLSSFMTLFQECCIAHTEELGMGREKTFDRGFLWIIVSTHIEIERMPHYDEDIILECYQSPTLHYFFPRNITVKNKSGELLIKATSLWSLIDHKTRKFIDPSKNNIKITDTLKDDLLMPVINLKIGDLARKKTLKVQYSQVDINGHLGNRHYMDMMTDDIFKDDYPSIRDIKLLFKKEIKMGSKFTLKYEKKDNKYFFHSKYFESIFTLK
ncbi:MAG: hypothetical protein K5906_01800 [Bacilli bacterium]|nr:hypothetical protein [Bacilli bacterium]